MSDLLRQLAEMAAALTAGDVVTGGLAAAALLVAVLGYKHQQRTAKEQQRLAEQQLEQDKAKQEAAERELSRREDPEPGV